jgi:uncharacterized membrane protein YbaN (DUF454 family)
VKKIVLTVLGFAALVLGGIGIFVPILPTTPFVLCAAGCFSAANPRIYRRLESSRYFGEYIKNYRLKTGISKQARIKGLLFLWITLGISAAIFRHPHVWIILGIVGIGVSIHILTIRRPAPPLTDT